MPTLPYIQLGTQQYSLHYPFSQMLNMSTASDALPSLPSPKRVKLTHNHPHSINRKFRCHSYSKRGKRCTKSTSTHQPGYLPVCKSHINERISMARCSALLECGYQCGEMFEWKLHGFRLCPIHLSQAPSPFLNLPAEIRVQIYGYLLPNKTVPAACNPWERNLFKLRHHNESVAIQLLLVSKKIYHEVAPQLYHQATFEICTTNTISDDKPTYMQKRFGEIQICRASPLRGNCSDINSLPPHFSDRQRLQDYQMQLMLLEQQNKRRLFAPLLNPYSSSVSFEHCGEVKAINCMLNPWTPRNILLKNFLQMRDFEVHIKFQVPSYFQAGHINYVDMHEFCDLLNTLSDRLATFSSSIKNLRVSITFIIVQHVKLLRPVDIAMLSRMFLGPLKRLRGISSAKVTSIATKGIFPPEMTTNSLTNRQEPVRDPMVQKFYPPVYPRRSEMESWTFINDWETDVTRAGPPFVPEVYGEYLKLANIVSKLSTHRGWMPAEREGLMNTMHRARIARENEDLEALRVQRNTLFELIAEHRRKQEDFNAYTGKLMYELMPV
jgi:hypothetical protein